MGFDPVRVPALAAALLLAVSCSGAREPATAEAALDHYEHIRAALARDDAGPLPEAAERLAHASRRAALGPLAARADQLAATPGSDLKAVRLAFGEVSREVVKLIAADPSLARGRYIFRCPMAQGYRKWVQTSAQLENPYMGSRMLRCGSETDWAE